MIRHYEEIGLLPAAQRSFSGYRQFSDSELHTLRFVRQARQLGFAFAVWTYYWQSWWIKESIQEVRFFNAAFQISRCRAPRLDPAQKDPPYLPTN